MRLLALWILLISMPARADIFAPAKNDVSAWNDELVNDRSGYYYHSSGVDIRQGEKKVSDQDKYSSGELVRDKSLYDLNDAFRKEFDHLFTSEGSFERYKSSRNSLLLLTYAAPALADVIKHYRTLTMMRLAMEERRLADIENGTATDLDRLRWQSERQCLREHQSEGLVKAMEACKKPADPFDNLPLLDGTTSLADGRRRVHVVRDAVTRLGLDEKGAGERVAALSGEAVIADNEYAEVLPKETFSGKVEVSRKKFLQKWKDVLANEDNTGLSDVSLPGVPVTKALVRHIKAMDQVTRGAALVKLSGYLAQAETAREFREAGAYLELAARLPGLPQVMREILRQKREWVQGQLTDAGTGVGWAEGYRAMLAGCVADADTARAELISARRVSGGAETLPMISSF